MDLDVAGPQRPEELVEEARISGQDLRLALVDRVDDLLEGRHHQQRVAPRLHGQARVGRVELEHPAEVGALEAEVELAGAKGAAELDHRRALALPVADVREDRPPVVVDLERPAEGTAGPAGERVPPAARLRQEPIGVSPHGRRFEQRQGVEILRATDLPRVDSELAVVGNGAHGVADDAADSLVAARLDLLARQVRGFLLSAQVSRDDGVSGQPSHECVRSRRRARLRTG